MIRFDDQVYGCPELFSIKVISLKNVSKSTRDLMLITLILYNKKPRECEANFQSPLASKAAKNKAPCEGPTLRGHFIRSFGLK
jgi:hypothetical protein